MRYYPWNITRPSSQILIDGIMDESLGRNDDVATDFFMYAEWTPVLAQVRTDCNEWAMTPEAAFIWSWQSSNAWERSLLVESPLDVILLWKNDNFPAFHGSFWRSRRMDFSFGQMPAAHNGMVSCPMGAGGILRWDNKWTSKVTNYERTSGFFEAAIPFNRSYKKGISEWGINFFLGSNLRTTKNQAGLPFHHVKFPSASLAILEFLAWDNPPHNLPGHMFRPFLYVLGALPGTLENEMGIMFYDERWGMDGKNRLDFFLKFKI